jgi:hypothetical protein
MILITSATGNNGAEIINGLAAKGHSIRAMVRQEPEVELFPVGVNCAIADFDDACSLRRALTGVERAFLVTPSSDKVEEQQLRFVDLAREAGVEHVVYLSQPHAFRAGHRGDPLLRCRWRACLCEPPQSSSALSSWHPQPVRRSPLLQKQPHPPRVRQLLCYRSSLCLLHFLFASSCLFRTLIAGLECSSFLRQGAGSGFWAEVGHPKC